MGRLAKLVLISVLVLAVCQSVTADDAKRTPASVAALPPVYQLQRARQSSSVKRDLQFQSGFANSKPEFFPDFKTLSGFDSLLTSSTKSEESSPLLSRQWNLVPKGKSASSSPSPAASVNDDEAFLEPDTPPAAQKRSSSSPTDIADIIADSKPSEQRFISSFEPSVGPFGRPFGPVAPPPPIRRRPVSSPSLPAVASRSPYIPPSSFDYYEGNNYLGSGNFEVLPGGVFRDAGDYATDYRNPRPNYQNDNYGFEPFLDDFFTNFRDFADINQDRN